MSYTQVVSNLVGNALRHGAPGEVVRVTIEDAGDEVVLTVANRGPAIPAELLPRLFEPFLRAVKEHRPTGGLGLGLYIVREIVKAHGGRVEVCSSEEETRFVVMLPRGGGRAA